MSSVASAAGAIHLGMDTSKNTIVVGILMPGEEVPVVDRIWNEEGSVRRLPGLGKGRGIHSSGCQRGRAIPSTEKVSPLGSSRFSGTWRARIWTRSASPCVPRP